MILERKMVEEVPPSSEGSEEEPAYELNGWKTDNYLGFEVIDISFDDHFNEPYNQKMDRNIFPWRQSYITLGFLNALSQNINIFPAELGFDQFMTILKLHSAELIGNLWKMFRFCS